MTADDYLRRVSLALRDLPWRQRRDLVAELRGHLAELPADTNLAERLGAPEQYAADMRSAAGLERRRGVIAFLRARRPRNVVITVVAVVLIGLAISTTVWVQNYQPLAAVAGFPPLLPAHAHIAPDGNAENVLALPGRPFQLGLPLQNTGRSAVRVQGVPIAGPFVTRLQMLGPFKSYKDWYRDGPGHYETFHPFDLEPGSNVILRLRGVYAKCGAYPVPDIGYTTVTDFPVRYSFLWRTSTATIPLPKKLTILEVCS